MPNTVIIFIEPTVLLEKVILSFSVYLGLGWLIWQINQIQIYFDGLREKGEIYSNSQLITNCWVLIDRNSKLL